MLRKREVHGCLPPMFLALHMCFQTNFPFTILCDSFGWILLNSKFIYVIGTIPTYLGKWAEKVNFGNIVAEIQQKYEREREKVGERECMNFRNVITEIPAARSACPSVCALCLKWDVLKKKPIVAVSLPK